MQQAIVFLDVDGVLLDYLDAYLRWAYRVCLTRDPNGDPIKVRPEWIDNYDMTTALSPWVYPAYVKPSLKEFCGAKEWYNMRPLADIRLLEGIKNTGAKVKILSACWPDWQAESMLRLTRHYGAVFDACTFCRPEEKAKYIHKALQMYQSAHVYFVEDSTQNLLDVRINSERYHPILVNQPYNLTSQEDFYRAADTNNALYKILRGIIRG